MVPRGFDQVSEVTCSEVTPAGDHCGRTRTNSEQEQTLNKKGVKSQVWRVKAKADDESASDNSTPIQAVGSSESF